MTKGFKRKILLFLSFINKRGWFILHFNREPPLFDLISQQYYKLNLYPIAKVAFRFLKG